MFGKGSKLYSITKMKCPRCHESDLFKTSVFEGVYNMHDNCPNCGQSFMLEPGFYWGAMYIGYGLSSAYMLGGFLVLMLGFGLTVGQSFGLLIVGGLIIMPWIARMARSIWINFYVSYNKDAGKSVKTTEG